MDTTKISASKVIRPDQHDSQIIIDRFFELQQQHLFTSWNDLLPEQQNKLLNDLESIDPEFLKKIHQNITSPPRVIKSLEPCKYIHKAKSRGDRAREEEARRIGETAIKAGKVALFLAAGGQGTRLNFKGTKGKCAVGSLTQHTLFQIYAEKILALQRRYEVTFPLWIMTSRENHAETEQFFFQNSLFGLLEKNIHFVQQEMLPSLDLSGKFFLSDPSTLVKNPNGDGGCLKVLKKFRAIETFLNEGYETLFCFHVDNPLIQIADATFLGWHLKENADFSAKVFTYS
ncbi:MAG: UTP--glucose-1-phosphate uridylyltransferase, partial [Planctomycetota bacterium]